jgi:protease PrsW
MIPATSPPPPPPAPGWFPDPWRQAPWRWWDGRGWTAHVGGAPGQATAVRKPRLPAWLSVPVLCASVLVVPLIGVSLVLGPVPTLLGFFPFVFVLPVLSWLDRVEPEPWSARVHALLWGATVSVVVALIVNVAVGRATSETVAAVVSAPLIEETMKGLGVLWAVRRMQVDGVMDGIVYAGWVAAGFAVVENTQYFLLASDDGSLVAVFVLRALLTPFAHPLFTTWIGLAVGLAVSRNRPVFPSALWGWALAVATHAAWNGSLTAADALGNAALGLTAAAAFIALFVAAVVMVVSVRRRERQRLAAAVPFLAARYGLRADEVGVFTAWGPMLAIRKRLDRPTKRHFDAMHAALARLAALHARSGPVDAVTEARLVEQLQRARTGVR